MQFRRNDASMPCPEHQISGALNLGLSNHLNLSGRENSNGGSSEIITLFL
jgi:hypothetical protein